MWTLVIYIYAGLMAHGDSVAMTTIQFKTQQECVAAGEQSKKLVASSAKELRYLCLNTRN